MVSPIQPTNFILVAKSDKTQQYCLVVSDQLNVSFVFLECKNLVLVRSHSLVLPRLE